MTPDPVRTVELSTRDRELIHCASLDPDTTKILARHVTVETAPSRPDGWPIARFASSSALHRAAWSPEGTRLALDSDDGVVLLGFGPNGKEFGRVNWE